LVNEKLKVSVGIVKVKYLIVSCREKTTHFNNSNHNDIIMYLWYKKEEEIELKEIMVIIDKNTHQHKR